MMNEMIPIPEQPHLGPHLPQPTGATGETCWQRMTEPSAEPVQQGHYPEETSHYTSGKNYRKEA